MNKWFMAVILLACFSAGGFSAPAEKKTAAADKEAVKTTAPAVTVADTENKSLTTEQIRTIMEKEKASAGDALLLLSSVGTNADEKELKNNKRIAGIKTESMLTAGDFAVMAIEMKKAKGGILYNLTGWGKYAAESLVYERIYPPYFSWNRNLSGQELIEFVTALKESK